MGVFERNTTYEIKIYYTLIQLQIGTYLYCYDRVFFYLYDINNL